MVKKKVLFINQEMVPYVPTSEMATMGRNLPQKIQENGFEIRTFMPKWGNINERRGAFPFLACRFTSSTMRIISSVAAP